MAKSRRDPGDRRVNPVGWCWVPVEGTRRPETRPGMLGPEGLDRGLGPRVSVGRVGRGLAIAGAGDGRGGAQTGLGAKGREGAAVGVRVV